MTDRLVQAIMLVDDLGAARREMETLGLRVEDGGRHLGRGTANLIVPFGERYLELLAVVDPEEAGASTDGQPVLGALARRGPGLARWSVEAADLGRTAARLGLAPDRRRRVRPDGVTIEWSAVAVNEAWAEPWRCAFMAWTDPALRPTTMHGVHPNGAIGFSLDVDAPGREVAVAWLGGNVPDGVLISDGVPDGGPGGPRRLTLATRSGPLVVG